MASDSPFIMYTKAGVQKILCCDFDALALLTSTSTIKSLNDTTHGSLPLFRFGENRFVGYIFCSSYYNTMSSILSFYVHIKIILGCGSGSFSSGPRLYQCKHFLFGQTTYVYYFLLAKKV